MRFILFLLSYSLNPLIIYTVPSDQSIEFLLYYTVGSAVFSLLMLLLFSFEYTVKYISHLIVLLTIVLVGAIPIAGDSMLWIIYPYSLLVGDYITTQSGSSSASNSYRLLMVLTALPFLFIPEYFHTLLILRIAIGFIFIAGFMIWAGSFVRLTINSPARWIAVTYIFYSGTLLLVPMIGGESEHVKVWYIGMQIGIGLILKRMDFSIRAIRKDQKLVFIIIDTVVFLVPVFLMALFFDPVFLTLYMVSVLSLMYLRRMENA